MHGIKSDVSLIFKIFYGISDAIMVTVVFFLTLKHCFKGNLQWTHIKNGFTTWLEDFKYKEASTACDVLKVLVILRNIAFLDTS